METLKCNAVLYVYCNLYFMCFSRIFILYLWTMKDVVIFYSHLHPNQSMMLTILWLLIIDGLIYYTIFYVSSLYDFISLKNINHPRFNMFVNLTVKYVWNFN